MGLEVAGVIVAVGERVSSLSEWKIGDRVCALLGGGGYAEYVAVKYDMLMPVPASFSMEEAACIPEVYATAYLNLMEEAKLKPEETLLIHAGGSGVGIAATQIAKAHGSRVIATVRSDEKAKAIEKFGADRIVNTRAVDERSVFEEESINVVLDCVGGTMLGECFSRLAKYGRWVMIATLGGVETTLDLRQLLTGNTRLIGSTLRSRTPEKKAEVLKDLVKTIYPYFESGAFRPEIYQVFPFEEAEQAQAVMQQNQNIGKLVLRMK
jgi:NADPH2:quinone reductase